jgi:hypothetical protein
VSRDRGVAAEGALVKVMMPAEEVERRERGYFEVVSGYRPLIVGVRSRVVGAVMAESVTLKTTAGKGYCALMTSLRRTLWRSSGLMMKESASTADCTQLRERVESTSFWKGGSVRLRLEVTLSGRRRVG